MRYSYQPLTGSQGPPEHPRGRPNSPTGSLRPAECCEELVKTGWNHLKPRWPPNSKGPPKDFKVHFNIISMLNNTATGTTTANDGLPWRVGEEIINGKKEGGTLIPESLPPWEIYEYSSHLFTQLPFRFYFPIQVTSLPPRDKRLIWELCFHLCSLWP